MNSKIRKYGFYITSSFIVTGTGMVLVPLLSYYRNNEFNAVIVLFIVVCLAFILAWLSHIDFEGGE